MALPLVHAPLMRAWIAVASTFSVTSPLVPPPVSPVPAFTAVMSPTPVLEHCQALPFHFATWLLAQPGLAKKFSVPGTPLSPLQGAVFALAAVPAFLA